MKTKFEITNEVFNQSSNLEECFAYYNEYYEDKGFTLDKENQECFIVFDREIQLNVGDMISLYATRTITCKCYDVINDVIEYTTEEY
jgi:hypothetical protein